MSRKTTALVLITMLNMSVIERKTHSERKWRWNINAVAVAVTQLKMRPDAPLTTQFVLDALCESRANHAVTKR